MSIQVIDPEITRDNLDWCRRMVAALPEAIRNPPPLSAEICRAAAKLGIPAEETPFRYYGKYPNLEEFAKDVTFDQGPDFRPLGGYRRTGRDFLESGEFLRYRGHYFYGEGWQI